ncbi:MAG: 30S ribosomal protein S6 [Pseudomonadota bacterium]
MREYETIFVTKTDLQYDTISGIKDKVKKILKTNKGRMIKIDDMGKRKFAFEVKGFLKGHYYYYKYFTQSTTIEKLNSMFGMDDNVLLYQTIILNKDVDLAKLEAATETHYDEETDTETKDSSEAELSEKTIETKERDSEETLNETVEVVDTEKVEE